MTSPNQTRSNVGLTYGLIGGIAMIIYTLCLYLAGVQTFMHLGLIYSSYALITLIAVLAGLKQKKLKGGFISFAEALKTVFLTFAIAFFLQTLFNYVLLNYIDTSFRDALTQATMEKTEEWLKKFSVPESDIEKTMESMASKNNYSIFNVFLGYGVMCIISCIVSLIIAAIIKKNKPPFDNAFKE